MFGASRQLTAAVGDQPVTHPRAAEPVDLVVVSLEFHATDPAGLGAVLSRYVVSSRMQEGCRTIDLSSSATTPGHYLIVEKWSSPEAQRTHFDSPAMVEMARSCGGLLAQRPRINLWDPISAHDLH